MRSLWSIIIFAWAFEMFSQSDSAVILKIMDVEDFSGLSNVQVTIVQNGIFKSQSLTNTDGILKFSRDLISGNYEVKIAASPFKTVIYQRASLRIKDTTKIYLEKTAIRLNQVEIVSYVVPMIGPRREYKSYRTGKIYTEEQLNAYSELSKGRWYRGKVERLPGTMRLDTFNKYLRRHINYPQLAKDLDQSETIVINFEVDKEGFTQNIKLTKGQSPILALEVARAIAKMPKLVGYYYEVTPPLKPLQFELPVKFSLK